MANYLVTGGAGFIGSSIVEHLVAQGEAVRVLDSMLTGKAENLAAVASKIELIKGDLRDAEACARAAEDMDYVLHLGALPSVPRSIDSPVESAEINVLGTVQLLHACVKAKVRRVVCAASSSAYGDLDVPAKVETLLPAPLSPYAAGKLAAEFFCKVFYRSYGLETVCLRYFNVFGPRQDPNSPYSAVVPLFITMMLRGEAPTIYGDGLQSRDFTHVENIVNANLLAVHAGPDAVGRTMNVACGRSYTLLDLLSSVNSVLGTKIEAKFSPARVGDVKHSLADISLAKKLIGYEVKISFEEGLKKTADWYRGAAFSC